MKGGPTHCRGDGIDGSPHRIGAAYETDNNLHCLAQCSNKYEADKTAAASGNTSSDTTVIVMDCSQNLTVPSVSFTPSQWYFCWIINVNAFGIYYENGGMQTNYVYDETVSAAKVQGSVDDGQVGAAVAEYEVSTVTVHISRGDDFFLHYKPLVPELYKNLSGVQQFQIFSMESSKPGVVQCCKGPGSGVEEKIYAAKPTGC
ncbi:hypothetical protein ON010_g10329 [Phytophthora cinnamomi]|nr:hypothetical protein ON010_g10329 [Phytophthora cinnamomi]